jgi:hypothetical protein
MRKGLTLICVGASLVLLCGAAVFAQAPPIVAPTFSVDFQGPTGAVPGGIAGRPDAFYGNIITDCDILSGALGGPPIGQPGAPVGTAPGLVVHGCVALNPPPAGVRTLAVLAPGNPGGLGPLPNAELDALSYGRDSQGRVYFSVDEFAAGDPAAGPGPQPPNLFTEAFLVGPAEASADVFVSLNNLVSLALTMPLAPVPGPAPIPPAGNTVHLDGDGIPIVNPMPGLGLIEPNPPVPGPLDIGDNLDALNIDTTVADIAGPIYFSLDAAFTDPVELLPANTGTAAANNFLGGDILVSPGAGAPIGVYAFSTQLGLDLGGQDTDDLDALILAEDGDGIFNPLNDLVVFSVRRHSHVTWGMHAGQMFPNLNLDSIFGAPIEEGDLLVPPGTPIPWAPGGVVPGPTPGILIPGEWLGLWTTRAFGPHPFISGLGASPAFDFYGDDLNAADALYVPEPCTLALIAGGVLLLLARRRKR